MICHRLHTVSSQVAIEHMPGVIPHKAPIWALELAEVWVCCIDEASNWRGGDSKRTSRKEGTMMSTSVDVQIFNVTRYK